MAEPEVVEVEEVAAPPEMPDYDSESVEDLEARMRAGEGIIQDETPDRVEEVPDVTETEPPPEPQAATEDVPPSEEAPAEPDLPDDRELQTQELQLQIERMRLDKQHFEHLSGKHATELDKLRQELQTSSARPSPAVEEYQYPEDTPQSVAPEQRTSPASDGLAGKVAELQQSNMMQETERVYNSFLDKLRTDLSIQGVAPDKLESETEAIMQKISPSLKQGFEPYGDLSTYPAKTLSKVTRMVLDSAYTDTKLAQVAELRKLSSERRATQIADTKIVKQAASPSGSTGRSVQEAPPKRVEDMTAEEADAALVALNGDYGG